MTCLFEQARHIRLLKQSDPEKRRTATATLLELTRQWFEDAMRQKDERRLTLLAERMDRFEQMMKE
jgi:hypothetical protein